MSSERPTTPSPRRSWRPSPEQVVKAGRLAVAAGKWLLVTAAATVTAILNVNSWVEQHVTETELEARLKPVDDNAAALLDKLADEQEARKALGAQLDEARRAQDEQRLELFENYWFDVGLRASELERDARKRDRAAEHARDRFEEYVRRGIPMREAFRKALRRGVP